MSKKDRILSYVDEIREQLEVPDSPKRTKSINHWCTKIEKEYEPKQEDSKK